MNFFVDFYSFPCYPGENNQKLDTLTPTSLCQQFAHLKNDRPPQLYLTNQTSKDWDPRDSKRDKMQEMVIEVRQDPKYSNWLNYN